MEQAADKSGRLGRRAGKKVISQADIAALDKNGYGYLAKIAKENPTDFEKILLAKKNLDADFASNGSRVFAKEGQSGLPPKFNQFFFTGKNAEKTAARWRSMTGLADDTQFTALAKSAGAIGDVIRVGKTGFDFGFMLLQGLPMLGRAVVNPSLFKVWGKATTNGFEAFFSKESTERFIKEIVSKVLNGCKDKLSNPNITFSSFRKGGIDETAVAVGSDKARVLTGHKESKTIDRHYKVKKTNRKEFEKVSKLRLGIK